MKTERSKEEFIALLLDVEVNPVVQLMEKSFVYFGRDDDGDRTEVLAACPLTQVAMKAGLKETTLVGAPHPSDLVQKFLLAEFDIEKYDFDLVWQLYDEGRSFASIAHYIETGEDTHEEEL